MPEETKGIFISYRRDDSAGYAGRIADRFIQHFGEDRVFRDFDFIDIELGSSSVEAIQRAVDSSEVLIAVIGKNWLTATDAAGRKRLENPDDYVRIEIATALKRNMRVIPLLVQGASMPSADELPEDLAPLVHRNAFELHDSSHDSSWGDDLGRLISALDRVLERRPARAPTPAPTPAPTQPDVLSQETIFISYSRKDWDKFVEPLVIDLRQQGFKVWIDQTFILGGDNWYKAIQQALETCERMVLCVSPDSLKSPYVQREYRYFMDEAKWLVPLICREAPLPWELQGTQYLLYQNRATLIATLRR